MWLALDEADAAIGLEMNPRPESSPGSAQSGEAVEQGIRDLMGLLALPALWAGRDGDTVLQLMAEAVERIVPLRFSLAQALLPGRAQPVSQLRVDGAYRQGDALADWSAEIQAWNIGRHPDGRAYDAQTPLGRMRIVHLSLGYGRAGGKIWFGASSAGFPTVTQLALLRAAASLAATGLQAARADYEREQASRAKDEFLAMLGHELRNPLAPIVMALELIRFKGGDTFSREHQIIDRQAKHLSRLVDDLLDVTRITRGKIELKRMPAELGNLLSRAVEDTSALFAERRHRLSTKLHDGPLWVYGDAVRLTQVFTNLLTNAAKYTDPGGEIRVRMQLEGEHVVVTVEDNGSGISPELFPRLFNIFEQGVATIDRAKGGLGIGLALVKSFVELHEGTVTAHSAGTGRGSMFTVRLPLLRHAVDDPVDAPVQPGPTTGALRVLVVDDNLDALASTTAYLSQRGHEVRQTSDPLEAVGLAERFRPQVAVLDIGLPVMDGYRLASELRRRIPAGSLRLVALTGYGQLKDLERSRAAGFDMHLVKPVSLQALDAALSLEKHDGLPV